MPGMFKEQEAGQWCGSRGLEGGERRQGQRVMGDQIVGGHIGYKKDFVFY